MSLPAAALLHHLIGLATCQFFYNFPMPVPIGIPHMVPFYVAVPVKTSSSDLEISRITPLPLERTSDRRGKVYHREINDK